MKNILISLLITAITSTAVAQENKFTCPIHSGKIIKYYYKDEVKLEPGAEFKSRSRNVYNILEGTVGSIDTTPYQMRVYLTSGDYTFSYNHLESVSTEIGETVKAGAELGTLKKGEQLFLIMSYKGELVDPKKYLKCKVIYKVL